MRTDPPIREGREPPVGPFPSMSSLAAQRRETPRGRSAEPAGGYASAKRR
jgi:hypothetical protein